MSVEAEYSSIASDAMAYAGNDPWDWICLRFIVYSRSTSCEYVRAHAGVEYENERVTPLVIAAEAGRAALSIRDRIVAESGDRIWGLFFKIFPSGKFKIEYSYEVPAGCCEEDEDSPVEKPQVASAIGAEFEARQEAEMSAPKSDSDAALSWLRAMTLKHSAQWGLGKEANWNLDLNAGQLHWTFSDGRIVHADIQVIGTFNNKNDSFLWGWDHPSVPQPLRRAATAAQAWGEANGVADFTIRNPPCSEDRTWVFAAIAAQQDGASGVYRGNANGTWVYVAFAEPEQLGDA